eukprot:TRINITY_DN3442_c0_g1_i2.p1 TRINITY_DN3442_c0_g1~~TRINITY_DN3442_c0_g1_i2.p1  ORF type:complete len:114 (-),score=50.26 TRINITY_DN3442_c0_g1_i2:65-406(-)
MDPETLKITELRKELQTRGLDTKGNKAVLVQRLKAALENKPAGVEEKKKASETPAAPQKEEGKKEETKEKATETKSQPAAADSKTPEAEKPKSGENGTTTKVTQMSEEEIGGG